MAELRFALALVAMGLKSSFALRGAFWLQASFMVANNLLYFVFWWVFFDRFEEIRGWRLADVGALFGIVAAGFGVAVVFAGGMRELSRIIIEGDLDAFLTQPKTAAAPSRSAEGWRPPPRAMRACCTGWRARSIVSVVRREPTAGWN